MAKYASNSNDDGDDVDPTDYTAVQRSMMSSNFDITDYAAKEPKPAPRPPTAVRIIPRNPTRTTTSVAAAATAATVNYWQLDDDEAADAVYQQVQRQRANEIKPGGDIRLEDMKIGGTKGYAPDQFYTRSTNEKGFSTKMRVNLSPAINAAVMEMVHSKEFSAYHSVSDFIRDAVMHRLQYLREHGADTPLIRELCEIEVSNAMMATHELVTTQRTEQLANAERMLDLVRKGGDTEHLSTVLHELDIQADIMPEPWAGRMREIIARASR